MNKFYFVPILVKGLKHFMCSLMKNLSFILSILSLLLLLEAANNVYFEHGLKIWSRSSDLENL